jgi:hypothetical protein
MALGGQTLTVLLAACIPHTKALSKHGWIGVSFPTWRSDHEHICAMGQGSARGDDPSIGLTSQSKLEHRQAKWTWMKG